MKSTLILTMFNTLTLAHLERSLFSLSKQTVLPDNLLFFDNNTPFSTNSIERVISERFSLKRWALYYAKHGDSTKQLSWNNNAAIRLSDTEVFILARADFIYDFTFCQKLLAAYADTPMNYSAPWMWQMNYMNGNAPDVDLEAFGWRGNPQKLLGNTANGSRMEYAATTDGPSFCTSKAAMTAGGWYDETLSQWGFNQQDLQTQMIRNGVAMKIVHECLAFHMHHPGDRDMERAKQEWARSPRRVPDILAEERRLKQTNASPKP